MSDPVDLVNIGTHAGGGLASGGFGAWLMHFFKSRREDDERKERTDLDKLTAVTLAELSGKMDRMLEDIKEHKAVFATVVGNTNAIKTIGEKLDDLRNRVEVLERRRK